MEQEDGAIVLEPGAPTTIIIPDAPTPERKRIRFPKKERQHKQAKRSHVCFREITPPEDRRTYIFPFNHKVIIEGVRRVAIMDSGNHRVETTTNEKYIVPAGWIAIKINTKGDWTF